MLLGVWETKVNTKSSELDLRVRFLSVNPNGLSDTMGGAQGPGGRTHFCLQRDDGGFSGVFVMPFPH